MKTQITIDRYSGDGQVARDNWKDLISALVLAGYDVYGDEDKIVFKLGDDDKIEETKE
jgi:hypothetical protein